MSSISGSKSLMRPTRFWSCLNFLPSPMWRARSRIDIRLPRLAVGPGPGGAFRGSSRCASGRGGLPLDAARGPPVAPLVAMLLHLPGELLGGIRHGGGHVVRAGPGAEGRALDLEVGLGDAGLADRGVLLLRELDVERGELRHLAADLLEALLDLLANLVRDLEVATLHTDPHLALLVLLR